MSEANVPFGIVVMGVSGCGKSSVGAAIAERLSGHFADGDDFHPKENVARMSQGIALTDEDRIPWLGLLNQHLCVKRNDTGINVIACSALKRKYRDILRDNAHVLFVHLHGDFDVIRARSEARENHFMSTSLLQSQFDTLEQPSSEESDFVVTVNIDADMNTVINSCVAQINQHAQFLQWKKRYREPPVRHL